MRKILGIICIVFAVVGCAPDVYTPDRVYDCSRVYTDVEVIKVDADFLYAKATNGNLFYRFRLPYVDSVRFANRDKCRDLLAQSPLLQGKVSMAGAKSGAYSVPIIPLTPVFAFDAVAYEQAYAKTARAAGFPGSSYRFANVTMYYAGKYAPNVIVKADTGRFQGYCIDPIVNLLSPDKSFYFNSIADGLNYLNMMGYEMVGDYNLVFSQPSSTYSFIMRKKLK